MDKLQWFKFSPTDWFMGKINSCNETTQAQFLKLCCIYWNKECVLSVEDGGSNLDQKVFNELIKKKIIKIANDYISIQFLDEQYAEILTTSEKRRDAALKRWNANGMQVHASALQTDADKRKSKIRVREEKEKELNISFDQFWSLYDHKKGRLKAEQKWNKLTDKERELAMKAIPVYIKSTPDRQYRKHPATYLNGKHWEDEVTEKYNPDRPSGKILDIDVLIGAKKESDVI